MERLVGTVVYGLRAPIIGEGDDIARISADTILNCQKHEQFKIEDKDVFALTESVVARAQGNYASVYEIQEDIEEKFGGKIDHLGVIFPILSRNRFSLILKGLALASRKVTVLFSYPGDEVGNHLVSPEVFEETDINPYSDLLTESEWVEAFGDTKHEFTGINYIDFYREIVEEAGAEFQAIFSNDALDILEYTHDIILGDVHSRARNRRRLLKAGVEDLRIYTLDEILARPRPGKNGYNDEYGLLGSNKATDEDLKLFPRDCQPVVQKIQELIEEESGKKIEVMVYGDGAFKDPTGRIWELADPVVSPAYTEGLEGIPNEVKLKYLADNDYAGLTQEEQLAAIRQDIQTKEENLVGSHLAEGTTPRQIPDLIGSLADLVSGSGDKGTPFVYIKGYFDNFGD